MTPKQLKKWRQRHGLSQAGAAERLRVSLDAVKSWEIGRRPIGSLLEQACAYHDLRKSLEDQGL